MKKLLTATVAALAMLATVPTAQAAQFWVEPGACADGSKTCIDVHMKGEIVKGDSGTGLADPVHDVQQVPQRPRSLSSKKL
jgi:hypothetical protein